MKMAELGHRGESKTMTKYSNGRSGLKPAASGNWICHVEPFSRMLQKTPPEILDDLRLKRAMQHAVRSEPAPQHVVDYIRNMIRE
jgi:hypothetical protein